MKPNRSWISLIGFCLLTVLGTALLFAVIVAGASVALAGHEQPAQSPTETQSAAPPNDRQQPLQAQNSDLTTINGMITDSYCGARHRRYRDLTPAECAAACIRNGAHFVLVNGYHRYALSGSNESLAKLIGTRANVTGTVQNDTIVVSSVAPML
ncbi:MAG TPA: hypothetical protein VFA90_05985 [Terriglobales bacterium]|nr:hypothetical protein [Terriglobales bacterium]